MSESVYADWGSIQVVCLCVCAHVFVFVFFFVLGGGGVAVFSVVEPDSGLRVMGGSQQSQTRFGEVTYLACLGSLKAHVHLHLLLASREPGNIYIYILGTIFPHSPLTTSK